MSPKKLTSKQEFKLLQDELESKLDNDLSEEFLYKYQLLKHYLDELEREIVKQNNLAKQ